MSAGAPKLAQLNYLVSSVLGSGPDGTVMLVTDKAPGGGRYALRVVKREDEGGAAAMERARAEFEASQKLGHASVLKCYDFRLRRAWFQVARAELLMEYLESKPLDALPVLDIDAAIVLFTRVAGALAHMHRRGVIHGDVCPSHVLLSRTGVVKVRRYGVNLVAAKIKSEAVPGGVYAAPEQVRDKVVDAQTDLYGLGATMYHALTGRPPAGDRGEGRKMPLPSALNVRIPNVLNNLIVACLQSQASKRPPDMYEAVKQLEEMSKTFAVTDDALVGLTAADAE
jgi:serine/threonine-protein kinase